jgi:hypothetical protein
MDVFPWMKKSMSINLVASNRARVQRFFTFGALSMGFGNHQDISTNILLNAWLGKVLLHQVSTRVSL